MGDKKKKNDENDIIQEMETEMNKISKDEDIISKLEKQIKDLTNELEKYKQIAANSQSQYVGLKYDFDSYISRIEKEKKSLKRDSLIGSVKNILPFVEDLRKTLESIDQENPLNQGITLVYQKIVAKLGEMGFEIKDCIGEEPNHDYHEPIGFAPSEDMKGKIVSEFEKCVVFRDGDEEIIVKPAKVLIGQ